MGKSDHDNSHVIVHCCLSYCFVFGCFNAPYSDFNLYPRAEPVYDGHEPINGEPFKVCVADAREVSRRNSRATVRRAYAQALTVECFDDFRRKDRLELLGIRVLVSHYHETHSCFRAPL